MSIQDSLRADVMDRHKAEYVRDGVTVIESAIPGPLLSSLRREAEKLRPIAASEGFARGQRPRQGCLGYADQGVDNSVFEEFGQLPRLREVISHVLGADFEVNTNMTIIFQGDDTMVQHFHRDNRHNGVQFEPARWDTLITDMRLFNQFNAALYDDASFWVVPGSHSRPDTDAERGFHDDLAEDGTTKLVPQRTAEMDDAEYEALALEYLRSMPGVRRIVLGAGDIAFYRQCGWHLGYYLNYHRRATLHGQAQSGETLHFWEQEGGDG
jgi:hypothetical protein